MAIRMIHKRYESIFSSKKANEIMINQKPMNKIVVNRVKKALLKKGVSIEQSCELDKWLISKGVEAITFSEGTMLMHTNVSASGFFEELIHYGQIKSGKLISADLKNVLIMELRAKEKLIKNKKAYHITDYEIEILTESSNHYKIQLENLKRGRGSV